MTRPLAPCSRTPPGQNSTHKSQPLHQLGNTVTRPRGNPFGACALSPGLQSPPAASVIWFPCTHRGGIQLSHGFPPSATAPQARTIDNQIDTLRLREYELGSSLIQQWKGSILG